ncbi:MAG: hypothetical protein HY581_01345 [Nitrospirae bacterium]|nr:hypothetical protein [Nitrospirota bacterium]
MARIPGRFSTELGLTLKRRRSKDLLLWFLASLLFGARISGTIAVKTYEEFVRRGVTTPERILKTGWDGLVALLDAGGYVRYDYKTGTKLLAVMRSLTTRYDGDLNAVHRAARDARDLEARLKALGHGIGDVTVQIFLRELRDIWPKAQPALSPLALLAADHLRLLEPQAVRTGRVQAETLRARWETAGVRNKTFSDFESALVRLGRDYCRRERRQDCPMHDYCGGNRVHPFVRDK